jgi:hypothetical protein
MAAVVQIKFKSSVAGGMHLSRFSRSQTGTNGVWLRHCAHLAAVFAVDPG